MLLHEVADLVWLDAVADDPVGAASGGARLDREHDPANVLAGAAEVGAGIEVYEVTDLERMLRRLSVADHLVLAHTLTAPARPGVAWVEWRGNPDDPHAADIGARIETVAGHDANVAPHHVERSNSGLVGMLQPSRPQPARPRVREGVAPSSTSLCVLYARPTRSSEAASGGANLPVRGVGCVQAAFDADGRLLHGSLVAMSFASLGGNRGRGGRDTPHIHLPRSLRGTGLLAMLLLHTARQRTQRADVVADVVTVAGENHPIEVLRC